jgi:glycosyltransferase involved in cell wall biosynthesis
MKVGVLSYPMLFQNEGGLQVQIRESVAQLQRLGVDVRLLDVNTDKLADFDIVHIFAATQGNDKLVEQARDKGCSVVLSSLLNRALVPPDAFALRAVKLLGSAISRLSHRTVTTNYETVKKALVGADHVIALSEWEKGTASTIYDVSPDHVTVIPNAVSAHFYEADAKVFTARYAIDGPFVFFPAQISPWKNQKTLVEALAETNITVVLAGPVPAREQDYFATCMAVAGAKVLYLGNLDRESALFAACFAAATAIVLPSRSESGPLVALEALAAGTPAIITRNNGLGMAPDGVCLSVIDPFDVKALRTAILGVLAAPPDPAACRRLVAACSWQQVGMQIKSVYEGQMRQRAAR